jgi:ATPase family protein associated with various cellular activities (AAA)/winged helix domain-containing protein
MTANRSAWVEENQRYLVRALAGVRSALERHAARVSTATNPDRVVAPVGAFERNTVPAPLPALEALCQTFGLSWFERAIVLLCAGPELDASFARLCAEAQGDAARPYPTFSLALAALPQAHWSALSSDAPLRYWRLIEVATQPGVALTVSPLRLDERILHFLTGLVQLDERLTGLLDPMPAEAALVPSHAALAQRIATSWSSPAGPHPVIQLCGADPLAKRSIAATGCAMLGLRLFALMAENLPAGAVELDSLLRLWQREVVLAGGALYVDVEPIDRGDGRALAVAGRYIERAAGAVLVGTRDRWAPLRRPTIALDVQRPTAAEQRAVWVAALGGTAPEVTGDIDRLVSQFSLSEPVIWASVQDALAGSPAGQTLGVALWDAGRSQARPRLDDLAQRMEAAAEWEDLVLPELQREMLQEILAHVRQRSRVYETWGFAAKGSRGLGISALFAGPSGTGKTMAAEVIANELGLDLYRIDLSQVVSKYIGETEKNLRRVFDAAEDGGAILLFDEADALFGKRSEVKDSHDRYANIEVGYLLQRMESYRGLAILTTNMKQALDPAFLRRIRFILQFPFPGADARAEIWRRIFPAQTPTEGLDASRLARLNLAGGNIRNIALNAAFLAADAGEPVGMGHLLRAARSEYAKLERPLTDAELGQWT